MTAARQVKQHCINIAYIIRRLRKIGPLSSGIATDAVSIFDLEETDGGPPVTTSRVEVFVLPSVIRASV